MIISYICLQQYCYNMEEKCNDKKISQLKAISDKQNDPKIKQVIDKKIEQVVKPFNK